VARAEAREKLRHMQAQCLQNYPLSKLSHLFSLCVTALTPQPTVPQSQKSRCVVTVIIVMAFATVFVIIVMACATVMVIMVVAVAAFTVILVMADGAVMVTDMITYMHQYLKFLHYYYFYQ
jgi:hypothetical protein